MATLSLWKLEHPAIQAGNGVITLQGSGAGANEVLHLLVRSPDNMTTKWEVTADANGFINSTIVPANGLGIYIISFDTSFPCGEPATPCYDNPDLSCTVIACAVSPAVTNLILQASKYYTQIGEIVSLYVSGVPNTQATIVQTWAGGALPHVVNLDSAGYGTIEIEIKSFFDTFLAMNSGLVSPTITITVEQGTNIPAPVAPDLVLSLAQIGTYSNQQDTVFAVIVRATNYSEAVQYLNLSSVAGNLQLELDPDISEVPITSGGFREFTIYLSGHHDSITTQAMTNLLQGSYHEYLSPTNIPASVQIVVDIAPRVLVSKFSITSVLCSPSGATVGDDVTVKIGLRNLGETNLTNLTLAPIQLGGVLGTIYFNGVSLPRGGVITVPVVIKMLGAGLKLIGIQGNLITASDGIGVVVGSGEASTSINVN